MSDVGSFAIQEAGQQIIRERLLKKGFQKKGYQKMPPGATTRSTSSNLGSAQCLRERKKKVHDPFATHHMQLSRLESLENRNSDL